MFVFVVCLCVLCQVNGGNLFLLSQKMVKPHTMDGSKAFFPTSSLVFLTMFCTLFSHSCVCVYTCVFYVFVINNNKYYVSVIKKKCSRGSFYYGKVMTESAVCCVA